MPPPPRLSGLVRDLENQRLLTHSPTKMAYGTLDSNEPTLKFSVISPSSMILQFPNPLNLSVLGCKMGITVSISQLYDKLNRQSAKFRKCCYVIILYRNNTEAVPTEVASSFRKEHTRRRGKMSQSLWRTNKGAFVCSCPLARGPPGRHPGRLGWSSSAERTRQKPPSL